MRVVVTGSAGRIGRAIVVRLAREHDVVGIDRLPASTAVRFVGDVCDRELLRRACEGADAIVHVAALHTAHVGIESEAEFERINVDGTAAVVAVAREHGVARVVLTSTTALYGGAGWVDEQTEPAPRTIYHRTKLAAEQLVREAASAELSVRVLRMSRCFPEPADVMAAYRVHRGVDARDVAAAHVLALTDGGEPYRVFVISGPTPFSPQDVDALARNAAPVLRERAPELAAAFAARGWRLPVAIDRVYSPARAVHELGWRPRFGFDEVLAMYDRGDADVLPPVGC
jgi:nucleoside-diphosphate-sugar epimerase